MVPTTAPPTVTLPTARRGTIDRLGTALLSGFAATTAMSIAALVAYATALGLGEATGNVMQQWLFALVHNDVMAHIHASLLGAVGINLAAGVVWALFYAGDAHDRLESLPGWARGVVFTLPLYVLSLVVLLPLVGAGFFGARIGAGPLPVIGNLILHLVYGATLGAMYRLDGAADTARADDPIVRRMLRQAETGTGLGVSLGALIGGGALLVVTLLTSSGMADVVGATVGGAVVGAALGAVFGSMLGLTSGIPTGVGPR